MHKNLFIKIRNRRFYGKLMTQVIT